MFGIPGKSIRIRLAFICLLVAAAILAADADFSRAAGLKASLCGKADLITGNYQKLDRLRAGDKGFTVAVASGYESQVLVNLAWRALAGSAEKNLAADALVLGPGQTKFVSFKAPSGVLTAGRYQIVLSVAGQKDQALEFAVEAGEAPAAQAPPATKEAGQGENVTQALTRVFSTKKGPEAAKAGVEVIGQFFDKEMSTPAGQKTPVTAASAMPPAAKPETPTPKPVTHPASAGLKTIPAAETKAPAAPSAPKAQAAAKPGEKPTVPAAQPMPAAEPKAVKPGTAAAPVVSGGVELVLARKVDARKAPLETTAEFSAQDKKIYLVFKGKDPALKGIVKVRWLSEAVEGLPPGRKMTDSREVIGTNSWNTAVFMPDLGGYWPGKYRVEVLKEDKLLAKLPFVVTSPYQAALLASRAGALDGTNLALAALGGKVLFATSQSGGSSWSKEGLIDGFGYGGENCTPACGWASRDRKFPQELVFAFNQNRAANLRGVVLDCESCPGDESCLASLPRLVEVWISNQDQNAGYTLAATRRILPLARRQFIPLQNVKAKYLKLVIKSNYGGSRRTQLAEVEILEKPGPDSVVKDLPVDLALPALGGSVLRYSSQNYGGEAVRLLQNASNRKGWRSKDATLPQEFTFCMRNHGPALIDRLELDLASGYDPASRPGEITVLLSMDSASRGFVEAARIKPDPTSEKIVVPLNQKARFVKLRILENRGAKYTSLGKVAIFEGKAPGYAPLMGQALKEIQAWDEKGAGEAATTPAKAVQPGLEAGVALALKLGERVTARFSNYEECHYYRLALEGDKPGMLNLELVGLPFLRTSLVLKDAQNREVAKFVPRRGAGTKTIVSWRVEPGSYLLEARTTPANIVLAWDVSGSMAGYTDLLQKAVTGFLERVRPSEKVCLIAFNNNLHVLTSGFTGDKQKLLAAVSGKFKAEMATRLYDAVEKGVRLLSDSRGAGAMIVLTDGMDMGSALSQPKFWELLDKNPVRIFTMGLGSELKVVNPKTSLSGAHFLGHVAADSGGRFIYIPDVSRLVEVYKRVAEEMLSGTAYCLKPEWNWGEGSLLVKTQGERIASLAAPPRIALVLDASGSMKKKLGKKSRMAVAKEVLSDLVKGLPPDVEVALRTYGHRVREGRKGDCVDTELVYPFSKLDKKKLLAKIRAIKPLGTTPIAYSLLQTAGDFGKAEGEKTVILVTDGKEECGGDLAKTVEELRAKGLDVRLHVVGFTVKDPKTIEQMKKAAEAGKGSYIGAADRKGLAKAMAQTLAIPFVVRDSAGREITRGVAGKELALPVGFYQVSLDTPKGEMVQRDVLVDRDKLTLVKVTKDGPAIGVQVMAPAARP